MKLNNKPIISIIIASVILVICLTFFIKNIKEYYEKNICTNVTYNCSDCEKFNRERQKDFCYRYCKP